MGKSKMKWLAIPLACFLLIALAVLPVVAAGEATATRSIDPDSVRAGETVTVQVDITINETLYGAILNENPPAGWTVTEVQNDGASFNTGDISWLWFAELPAGTTKTIIYQLTTAGEGTYSIAGTLASGILDPITVGGETDVAVTVNHAPGAPTLVSPANGATDVSRSPALTVTVNDSDGDAMTVTFYDASDNSVIGTVSGIASGGTAACTWSGLDSLTPYSWYAKASDGALQTQSSTWSFTTIEVQFVVLNWWLTTL